MMNIGYIELGGGGVSVRIYYNTASAPVGETQPLIDGPRGFCLDLTNTTGRNGTAVINGLGGSPQTVMFGQGDPVISGPVTGRSRTAAQLASFGFTTRGNVGEITLTI